MNDLKPFQGEHILYAFFLVASLQIFTSKAQWLDSETGTYLRPTPEMWSFPKYGDAPVDLHTGTMHYSIPLHVYKDDILELPITIDYSSNGFMPNIPTGTLGMGWHLNAGGAVTRKVNYKNDEYIGAAPTFFGYKSYLGAAGTFPSLSNIQYDKTLEDGCIMVNGRKYEPGADEFTFNVMGHSGKFVLGPGGKPIVYETGSAKGLYTVSIENFDHITSLGQQNNSRIIISTHDGFRFTFGSLRYLKSIKYRTNNNWYDSHSAPQLIWPLISITGPGGRPNITFSYEDEPVLVESVSPELYYVGDMQYDELVGWYFYGHWGMTTHIDNKKQYVYNIKNIRINDRINIDFTYRSRGSGLGGVRDQINPQPMDRQSLLSKVVVRTGTSNEIKTIDFTYQYSSGNSYPFLQRVKTSNEGTYSMQYYDLNKAFPYHGTTGVDHWGYYNGNETYRKTNFVPSSTVNSNNVETITGNTRNPNFNGTLMGMLKMITFPTGGSIKVEYESNTYRHALRRNYGDAYLETVNNNTITGGLRVRSITSTSESGTTVRGYRYEKNGVSSGVQLHMPRYKSHDNLTSVISDITFPGPNRRYQAIDIQEIFGRTKDKTHVEYHTVIETNPDGSSIEHQFTSYQNGYIDPTDLSQMKQIIITGISTIADRVLRQYLNYPSMHFTRGRLLRKTVYGADGRMQYSEVNEYRKPQNYSPLIYRTRYMFYNSPIYTDNLLLTKKTVSHYFNNTPVTTTENYSYTANEYIQETSIVDNNGKTVTKKYRYSEAAGLKNIPYPEKVQLSVSYTGTTPKLLEGAHYKYTNFGIGSNPKLTEYRKTNLSEPIALSSDFSFDSRLELEATFEQSASATLGMTDREGRSTAFIYDPGYYHLLATVENATHSQVQALLRTLTNPVSYATLSTEADNLLRSRNDFLVTTYRYERPYFGISEIKYPSGKGEHYGYDDAGRLNQKGFLGYGNIPGNATITIEYGIATQ